MSCYDMIGEEVAIGGPRNELFGRVVRCVTGAALIELNEMAFFEVWISDWISDWSSWKFWQDSQQNIIFIRKRSRVGRVRAVKSPSLKYDGSKLSNRERGRIYSKNLPTACYGADELKQSE